MILVAERDAALREVLAQLPLWCRHLLSLVIADPPVPYAEISTRLAIPVGSIGPIRARCSKKLHRCPALTPLLDAGAGSCGTE